MNNIGSTNSQFFNTVLFFVSTAVALSCGYSATKLRCSQPHIFLIYFLNLLHGRGLSLALHINLNSKKHFSATGSLISRQDVQIGIIEKWDKNITLTKDGKSRCSSLYNRSWSSTITTSTSNSSAAFTKHAYLKFN